MPDNRNLTDNLNAGFLRATLTRTAKEALEGNLSDEDRIALYRLALTVCAEEFYRIESNGEGGAVKPETLMLLQQIELLCSDNITPEKLVESLPAGPAADEVEAALDEQQED